MTRIAAIALLLAGCPGPKSDVLTADCCEPVDAGDGCRWRYVEYRVPRFTEDFASDDNACASVGLLPYRQEEQW